MNPSRLLSPAAYARRARRLPEDVRRCMDWMVAHQVPTTIQQWKIRQLRDRHRGRRAFVLGNGPSLQIADVDRLKGEITFASNKIYLAFDQTSWRPTYYSVCDLLVAQNNRDVIHSLDLVQIHGAHVRSTLGEDHGYLYIEDLPNRLDLSPAVFGFSKNMLLGANGGFSIIYLQLQLAYYMGIRQIYLIGVDFSFNVPASIQTQTTTELGEQVLQAPTRSTISILTTGNPERPGRCRNSDTRGWHSLGRGTHWKTRVGPSITRRVAPNSTFSSELTLTKC